METKSAGRVERALESTLAVVGRYRVDGTLGEGRDGITYLVTDPLRPERRLALRLLRGCAKTRAGRTELGQTLALQSQVQHPNLAEVYDYSLEPTCWYVMEHVDGVALATLRLAGEELARVILGVCRGLAALHRGGLAHGGIQPSSILVWRDGDELAVKLLPPKVGDGTRTMVPSPADDLAALGAMVLNLAEAVHVPPALAALGRQLSASDPRDRLTSAEQAVAALLHTTDRFAREGRLAGREAEMACLEALYAETRDAGSRQVLVEGSAGIGKTRLVQELCERARSDGATIIAMTCTGAQPGRRVVDELSRLLGDRPRLEDPTALVEALIDRWADRSTARDRPIVLVIENVESIDDVSLAVVIQLRARLAAGPVVPGVLQILTTRHAGPLAGQETISLQPLPPAAVRCIVDALRGAGRASDTFALRVTEIAGGNALFVSELVALARDRGGEAEPLPVTLVQTVSERLRLLPEPVRRVAWAAAMLGPTFDPGVLVAAHRDGSSSVAALVAGSFIVAEGACYRFAHPEVREAAIVDARGGDGWVDLHGQLARTLASRGGHPAEIARLYLESADPQAAVGYLTAAAAAAYALHDHAGAVASYDVALSLAPAGAARRDLHLGRLAAIRAGGLGLPDPRGDDALAAAAGHLSCEIDVRLELARIATGRGRFAEAIARAAEVHALSEVLEERKASERAHAEAHRTAGLARHSLGQLVAAKAELDAAVAAYARLGDGAGHAAALNDRGFVHGYGGDHAAALADHESALAILRGLPPGTGQSALAATYNNLGFAAWSLGHYDVARGHLGDALVLRRRLSDLHGEGVTRNNIGNVLRHQGDLDGAREQYRAAVDLCRRAGNVVYQAIALNNLGQIEEELGHLEEAERLYCQALDRATGIGDRIREGDNLGSLGSCLLRRGKHTEAVCWLRRAVALRREIGDRSYLVLDLSYLAVAELGAGEREQARATLDEAIAIVDSGQEGIEQVQVVFLNSHLVAADLGETALARVLLARAHRALMVRQQSIADLGAARAFVERVRVNREILARAHREGLSETTPAAVSAVERGIQTRSTFVGRERERAELFAALDAAAASRGGLWLVTGEPGIGKTRLCEELEARARDLGFAVVWGQASDGGGAPAYWPWVQVIQSFLRSGVSQTEILEAMGEAAARDLSCLSHELRPIDEASSPTAPRDPPARFRISDAYLSFLRAASAVRPLVIFLDDLHGADVASLKLLQFVARELRHLSILIVATYREEDLRANRAVAPVMLDIARSAMKLPLRGLDEPELAELVGYRVGGEMPFGLIKTIHRRTEGNPLFARELARDLAATVRHGVQTVGTGDVVVPRAITDVILRRLALISPAARDIFLVAAIAGRTFDLALVSRLCVWNVAGCLLAMEEGMRAGVVMATANHDVFRFTSSLVRTSVYQEIPLARRAELHLAFAQAAEESYGAGPDPRYAELAHHFALGVTAGGQNKLARYQRLAGERAASQGAFEEAARHLIRALESVGAEGRVLDRCQILVTLGDVQLSMADVSAAESSHGQAAQLARELGDRELLARAALGLAGARSAPMRFSPALLDLFAEALAALGPALSSLRARLLARLATELVFTARHAERELSGREAIAVARQIGQPSVLGEVLVSAHGSLWTADNLDERFAMAGEIDALAARVGDRELAAKAGHARFLALLERDDVHGAEVELSLGQRMAREQADPRIQWQTGVHAAMLALVHGSLEEAERHAADANARGEHLGLGIEARRSHVLLLWRVRKEQDRLSEVAAQLEALAQELPLVAGRRQLLAHARLAQGHALDARAHFDAIVIEGLGNQPRDAWWLGNMVMLGELAIHFRDQPVMREIHDLLLPFEAHHAVDGRGAVVFGPVSFTLGLLADGLQQADAARRHLGHAGESAGRSRNAGLIQRVAASLAHVRPAASGGRRGEQIAAARPAPCPDSNEEALRMTLDANLWQVTWGRRSLWVRDSKGMQYLAALVQHAGEQLHVTQLVDHAEHDAPAKPDWNGSTAGSAGERAEMRARLEDLREIIEEAERHGDTGRRQLAQAELERLGDALASSVGIGRRRSTSRGERLRQSVTKRVREAIKRIGEQDPKLGMHLSQAVRTGIYCAYAPVVAARQGARG